jgi:hypothetical protein
MNCSCQGRAIIYLAKQRLRALTATIVKVPLLIDFRRVFFKPFSQASNSSIYGLVYREALWPL